MPCFHARARSESLSSEAFSLAAAVSDEMPETSEPKPRPLSSLGGGAEPKPAIFFSVATCCTTTSNGTGTRLVGSPRPILPMCSRYASAAFVWYLSRMLPVVPFLLYDSGMPHAAR